MSTIDINGTVQSRFGDNTNKISGLRDRRKYSSQTWLFNNEPVIDIGSANTPINITGFNDIEFDFKLREFSFFFNNIGDTNATDTISSGFKNNSNSLNNITYSFTANKSGTGTINGTFLTSEFRVIVDGVEVYSLGVDTCSTSLVEVSGQTFNYSIGDDVLIIASHCNLFEDTELLETYNFTVEYEKNISAGYRRNVYFRLFFNNNTGTFRRMDIFSQYNGSELELRYRDNDSNNSVIAEIPSGEWLDMKLIISRETISLQYNNGITNTVTNTALNSLIINDFLVQYIGGSGLPDESIIGNLKDLKISVDGNKISHYYSEEGVGDVVFDSMNNWHGKVLNYNDLFHTTIVDIPNNRNYSNDLGYSIVKTGNETITTLNYPLEIGTKLPKDLTVTGSSLDVLGNTLEYQNQVAYDTHLSNGIATNFNGVNSFVSLPIGFAEALSGATTDILGTTGGTTGIPLDFISNDPNGARGTRKVDISYYFELEHTNGSNILQYAIFGTDEEGNTAPQIFHRYDGLYYRDKNNSFTGSNINDFVSNESDCLFMGVGFSGGTYSYSGVTVDNSFEYRKGFVKWSFRRERIRIECYDENMNQINAFGLQNTGSGYDLKKNFFNINNINQAPSGQIQVPRFNFKSIGATQTGGGIQNPFKGKIYGVQVTATDENGIIYYSTYYPMQENADSTHYDVVLGNHATVINTNPSEYWSQRQNMFFFNEKYGYTFLSGKYVPSNLTNNGFDVLGNSISNFDKVGYSVFSTSGTIFQINKFDTPYLRSLEITSEDLLVYQNINQISDFSQYKIYANKTASFINNIFVLTKPVTQEQENTILKYFNNL